MWGRLACLPPRMALANKPKRPIGVAEPWSGLGRAGWGTWASPRRQPGCRPRPPDGAASSSRPVIGRCWTAGSGPANSAGHDGVGPPPAGASSDAWLPRGEGCAALKPPVGASRWRDGPARPAGPKAPPGPGCRPVTAAPNRASSFCVRTVSGPATRRAEHVPTRMPGRVRDPASRSYPGYRRASRWAA
jgi:hypothetical protein